MINLIVGEVTPIQL